MKKSAFLFALIPSISFAALPPQYFDCLRENSGTSMSVADLKEIAKAVRVTYCQNQVGFFGVAETKDLLSSPNIQVGISLAKTNYSQQDFLSLASAGSYVLYVDSARLNRIDLNALAAAKVQLVIVASSSGLSKLDLLQVAQAKPFILNVDVPMSRSDLLDYVNAKVQVVIRSGQSGISRADILALAQVNSELVTVLP